MHQCWDRAGQLAVSKNVTAFPGGNMFAVYDMGLMLQVTTGSQDGELVCSNFCRLRKPFKNLICPHVLAVAESTGRLAEFIEFCHDFQARHMNNFISFAGNPLGGM